MAISVITAEGTEGLIHSGTAQASTSGTSIDFTGIPSWVKRITVMFDGVSTNGSSDIIAQIGSGSITTSGYTGSLTYVGGTNTAGGVLITNGFGLARVDASTVTYGIATFTNFGSNIWTHGATMGRSTTNYVQVGGGRGALGSVLDRIRITTVNGTDTFDAGSINILYE